MGGGGREGGRKGGKEYTLTIAIAISAQPTNQPSAISFQTEQFSRPRIFPYTLPRPLEKKTKKKTPARGLDSRCEGRLKLDIHSTSIT